MRSPKKITPTVHKKGWGREIWIVNNEKYCGKILEFNSVGASFSMHFHIKKDETFYVQSGMFKIEWYNLSNANRHSDILHTGDAVHIPPNTPHKITCLGIGSILEVSTTHDEEDSYRVEKGDSQK